MLSYSVLFKELLHAVQLIRRFGFNPIEVIPHVYVWPQDIATFFALRHLFGHSSDAVKNKMCVGLDI